MMLVQSITRCLKIFMTRLNSFPSTLSLTVSTSTEEDNQLRTGDGRKVVEMPTNDQGHLMIDGEYSVF